MYGRGKADPQREVGKMGYLILGITYVVLGIIAASRPRTGHV
jgi:hypothetical protein